MDLASPGPIGGTTPAAGTFTRLAAATTGNQHTLTSAFSGTLTFDTANVLGIRHTLGNGASAIAMLRHSDGFEMGAVGYKNVGSSSSYLDGAIYLAGGIYSAVDGTSASSTPPKIIIGQEAGGGGAARILLDTDYTLHFKNSAGVTHTKVGATGGWHVGSTGATATGSMLDVIGQVATGDGSVQSDRNNDASGRGLSVMQNNGQVMRLVKPGVVGLDLTIAGSGATRRLDIIDKDNGSVIPLSLSLTGSGAVTHGGVTYLKAYTIGTLPAATAAGLIYVSDETGGATLAFSDGTNWRRAQDRAIVS